MTKILSKLFFASLLLLLLPTSTTVGAETPIQIQTQEAEAAIIDGTAEVLFGAQQRNSRNSAVKVEGLAGGHGSGTYIEVGNHYAVITARHVVDDSTIYHILSPTGERVVGQVVWKSQDKDIAVLKVPRMQSRSAMELRGSNDLNVGDSLLYTGYPSNYEMLTSRATVSGHAEDYYNATLLQGFVWFGYSGSGAFDDGGKLRAIVVAIGVERFYGRPTPLPAIVYTFEISRDDVSAIRDAM